MLSISRHEFNTATVVHISLHSQIPSMRCLPPSPDSQDGAVRRSELCYDVILHIVRELNDQELLAITWTCKQFREDGIKELLSRGVHLKEDKITSFHTLVTASSERFWWLRGLFLQGPPCRDTGTLNHLVELFNGALNLRVMMVRDLENLLSLDNRIAPALANLLRLRQLYVDVGGNESYNLVQSLLPRLAKVSIEFTDTERVFYLGELLVHSSNDLTELHVSGASFANHNSRFLQINTLVIMSGETPLLADLISAFPNLRVLQMQVYDDFWPDNTVTDNHHYHTQRAENAIIQERDHWQHLDRLSIGVPGLYTFGITCPITHLIVRSIDADKLSALTSALSDYHPACLELEFGNSFEFVPLPQALPAPIIPGLTHFSLVWNLKGSPLDYNPTNDLLALLRPLRIRCLMLYLRDMRSDLVESMLTSNVLVDQLIQTLTQTPKTLTQTLYTPIQTL
ncbi:hypothetical protein A0H81_14757 [Grifola frondosa]|uniref:F-box domain-containing protein n=1 Tax=Grifola frondosa TaxID=5627 RepID=A0A1C7LKH8_GRIFR|nr:hypothetical protein A0H81_14757 [Grifola frondosa]